MDSFLKGKAAMVTGGTRGIGYAIAEKLLQAGAAVAICGRSAEGVETAVSSLLRLGYSEVCGKAADVSNVDDVAGFYRFVEQKLGGLDILVNNAGIGVFRSVGDLSCEEWKQVLDTNLSGVFYCCREALPLFRQRGGGFVVNIGSLAGKNPFAGGAAYNASKFGLNGFTEAMMLDHRYDNVRVSCIMPGSVDTEFSPRTAHGDRSWKIAAEDVAEVVMAVLRMPERTLISRVEIRPSRPQR